MTIGEIIFETRFQFNSDGTGRADFGRFSIASGLAQLLIILIALIIALGFTLYLVIVNGAAPPYTGKGIGYEWPHQFGVSPACLDNPGLSGTGFNETLRGRLPIAGDFPTLRLEDPCNVPVF